MPRLIDADALLKDITHRYCENCDRRKGMKNGAMKTIYEIGEAPCRACEVDDMEYELESAPTVDAVEVVRCKDCKHYGNTVCGAPTKGYCKKTEFMTKYENDFCSWGEKR